MRKKIASSIVAVSLAVAATPVVAPAPATAQTARSNANSEAISRGIEKAFDPKESSSLPKNAGFKEYMQLLFTPYKQAFSGDLETSSQGVTRAIINYVIIAAGVTVVGQIIQLAMANMPR